MINTYSWHWWLNRARVLQLTEKDTWKKIHLYTYRTPRISLPRQKTRGRLMVHITSLLSVDPSKSIAPFSISLLFRPAIWRSRLSSRCSPTHPALAWSTAGSRGRRRWKAGRSVHRPCSWEQSRRPCTGTPLRKYLGWPGLPCLSVYPGLQSGPHLAANHHTKATF